MLAGASRSTSEASLGHILRFPRPVRRASALEGAAGFALAVTLRSSSSEPKGGFMGVSLCGALVQDARPMNPAHDSESVKWAALGGLAVALCLNGCSEKQPDDLPAQTGGLPSSINPSAGATAGSPGESALGGMAGEPTPGTGGSGGLPGAGSETTSRDETSASADTGEGSTGDEMATENTATTDASGTEDTATESTTTTDGSPSPEPLPPGDCINNRQDGDETGVDCGGSCEPCVDYDIGPPQAGNADRSGCEMNGNGFMCAQSMVFSPSMKQAAGDDWGSEGPSFVYGVVGHDPDPGGVDGDGASYNSACCQCYQLVFRAPMDPAVSIPAPKPMIVQAFNTYAGGPSAFDIYMAAGGHGNFNGCTENGSQYSAYPDLGGDWTGGVRATRYPQCSSGDGAFSEQSIAGEACQGHIANQCSLIEAQEPTQAIARQSCVAANRVDAHYHMNWYVAVKRVECPENLTKVTGCRLAPQGLPEADPSITSFDEALAAGFSERSPNTRDGQDPLYHTTTMEDCCRPTCAWDANTQNTTGGYDRFYTCDQGGSRR